MRKIRDKDLAELLVQVRFAPPRQRRKQVDRAEELLDIIEKDKEYPFEFVCYRITDFRPKGEVGHRLLRGEDLAEDLRIFLWKLSGQVAPPAQLQGEEVYTTEQLAKKLGVSTKTIDRWRKRGLRVRKFIFENGRKRLGFLQSAVDRFLGENPGFVNRAREFARLSSEEKRQIIKRAGELSSRTKLSRRRIIQQITGEVGRGQETIRCVLLNYQKTNPDRAKLLREVGELLSPAEGAEVERLQRQGMGIRELMKRFGKSRSSIYRILKKRRVQALLARQIEYVESDEFGEENAEERILGGRIELDRVERSESFARPELSGHSLGEYLEGIKDAPVLNRQQEEQLFRRYNYLKYRACAARADISAGDVPSARLDEIEKYLEQAEEVKKVIIEANLRLVVSVAGKHTITGANLADLVSEGNVSLMQAVEKFDYMKGFRFATYASWAISKDFAHRVPGQKGRAGRAATDLAEFAEEMKSGATDLAAVERARHNLIQVIRDNLEEREQYIIINHFGLEGTLVKKNKKTLKQIGEDLGLSKERIRQIELVGLQKLRQSLSPEQFELLMG